jgi:glycosyltransferase involved in cell wall biosynthesis
MIRNKVVVISEASPPIGDTLAEGGSLRAWGIAKSLADIGHNVTFIYRDGYQPKGFNGSTAKYGNVSIAIWKPGLKPPNEFVEAEYVVIRHSHAEANLLVHKLTDKQKLIVDCYIPIHVEVSARESKNKYNEYLQFLNEDSRWLEIIVRGDYFLYASESQKLYLLGYLAGCLLLNPLTYREIEDRLIKLPYCYFKSDASNKIPTKLEYPTLLWYGGLYSWFDIGSLVPGLLQIKKKYKNFKFILAGAKNPYVADPSIVESYNASMKKLEPIKNFLVEIPHQSYDKRFKTYSQASAIVYINKMGLENELAWRTRLVDYILAKKPIITNGGDPLGEDLIEGGLGFKLNLDDPNSLLKVFDNAIKTDLSEPYNTLLHKYSWEDNILNLGAVLNSGKRIDENIPEYGQVLKNAKATRLANGTIYKKIKTYHKQHGLKKTIKRVIKLK